MKSSSTEPKYLKRFRMEIDFRDVALEQPKLPEGYHWVKWHSGTLHNHALVKFESFHTGVDTQIFPALRTLVGCRELMQSIMTHSGFLPQSTWLIQFGANEFRPPVPCGTIQGLVQSTTLGAIQNIGVIPEHRGFGLGRALLLKNLHGFRAYGLQRTYLDVTAENTTAISLYESLGFKHIKTSYREVAPELPVTG